MTDTTLTDEQISQIASGIYGTKATAQEMAFARALLSAKNQSVNQAVNLAEQSSTGQCGAEPSLGGCPCCGGSRTVHYVGSSDWMAYCDTCPVTMSVYVNAAIHGYGEGEKSEAIRLLNRRAQSGCAASQREVRSNEQNALDVRPYLCTCGAKTEELARHLNTCKLRQLKEQAQ